MNNRQILNNILLSYNVVNDINKNIKFITDIIPEISSMIGFEHKHPHHDLDVYNHTLKALSNSKKDLHVRIALLLHDIGKPFSYQDEGTIRHFHGHPKVSAEMSEIILKRLGYEEDFISDIIYLVENHDSLIDTENLDNNIELVRKRLEIQFADAKAHKEDKVEKRLNILNKVKESLNNPNSNN